MKTGGTCKNKADEAQPSSERECLLLVQPQANRGDCD